MDYEKKYKKLIGKIEKAYLYAQTDSTKAVLEEIRHELKESEEKKVKRMSEIEYQYYKLKAWREILSHIRDEYGDNRSIGNVLQNINARIKGREKMRND